MLHLKSANHELTQLQLELPVKEVVGGGRLMTIRGEDIPRLLKFNLHDCSNEDTKAISCR